MLPILIVINIKSSWDLRSSCHMNNSVVICHLASTMAPVLTNNSTLKTLVHLQLAIDNYKHFYEPSTITTLLVRWQINTCKTQRPGISNFCKLSQEHNNTNLDQQHRAEDAGALALGHKNTTTTPASQALGSTTQPVRWQYTPCTTCKLC